MRIAGVCASAFFCCFGEGNFLFIYFSLKGEDEQLKKELKEVLRI